MSEHLEDLYQDLIMDHHRHPKCYGWDKEHPVIKRQESFNPLCGDRLCAERYIDSQDREKFLVRFEGQGCAMCIASASLVAEHVNQKSLKEAQSVLTELFEMLNDQDALSKISLPKKLQVLSTVKAYPSRVKCVTLSWHLFKDLLAVDVQKEKD